VTRQAVTKHLRVLAGAGVARSAHVGRETIWTFEPAPLAAAQHYLGEISARWDDALVRLKAMVEEDAGGPALRLRRQARADAARVREEAGT
jgi:hypothetical protein